MAGAMNNYCGRNRHALCSARSTGVAGKWGLDCGGTHPLLEIERAMNFTGEITIRAPREAVFEKLRDARFFASCLEGVKELNEIDETHYTAVLETRVAYIKFQFNVTVEVVRLERPSVVEAKVEGTPTGIVGRLTATSVATLREEGEDTAIAYSMDVSLTGKLGSLGQPVLKSKAKEMEKQFAANIRRAFEPAGEGAAGGGGAP
jgi:hypothetical protein